MPTGRSRYFVPGTAKWDGEIYVSRNRTDPNQIILSKAGINVWASQKLKTSFGPVMSSLGVRPLKKLVKPSFLAMLERILNPLSGFSKLRFWIRVLMTSNGADTRSDADAPTMEAMKF